MIDPTTPVPDGAAPSQTAEQRTEAAMEGRVPTVVAEDVHVTYRVHTGGAKHSTGGTDAASALRRIVRRDATQGVQEIRAVRGVSFVAHKGEAIGLIGRNGSGKSTLLQAIAGLLPADRGAVYTSAQPSLLGVNAALVPTLSGEKNINLGSLAMGLSPEQARAKYDAIVEFAGIGDFVNLPMSTYSSGMAARLRFAIAASVSYDILLIDEALATGDAEFQERSQQRIHELRAEAGTVFLVSHGLDVVRSTCNRAIWLEQGKILMDGPVNVVADAYEADVEEQRHRVQAGGKPRQAGAARD